LPLYFGDVALHKDDQRAQTAAAAAADTAAEVCNCFVCMLLFAHARAQHTLQVLETFLKTLVDKPAHAYVRQQMMQVLTTLLDLAELGDERRDGGGGDVDIDGDETAAREPKYALVL
jgi:hypothetical protein